MAARVVVRPAGGGADEPSSIPYGEVAASAPTGRRVALVSGSDQRLNVSLWQP